MTQSIKNFAEGLRKGLGIVVRRGCGKTATFRTSDFRDIVGPGENIEDRVRRCSWCNEREAYVRYTTVNYSALKDRASASGGFRVDASLQLLS